MPRLIQLLALAFCALSSPVFADSLVTVDGRIIEVDRVRQEGESYRLMFPIGEVLCPAALVASVEIEGDMSDYEPKNDKERKFLEDGYVRYKNKWMSKAGYERELEKKAEASRSAPQRSRSTRTSPTLGRRRASTSWFVRTRVKNSSSTTRRCSRRTTP